MRNLLVPPILLFACLSVHAGQLPLMSPKPEASAQLAKTYGQLPLSFELNQGQTDNKVKFISRGQGYTLFLTPDEAVLALRKSEPKADSKQKPIVPTLQRGNDEKPPHPNLLPVGEGAKKEATETLALRMKLVGSNPDAKVEGLEELPGKVNYLKGKDPKQWRTAVATYGKVKMKSVYDGVDLVYYGNGRQLEYDFIVQPGADPNAIRLNFSGADTVKLDKAGDLLLHTKDGELRLQKPVVYQTVSGKRQNVEGRFVLHNLPFHQAKGKSNSPPPQGKACPEQCRRGKGERESQQVSFQVAAYDAAQPLVIDPVLVYSTYLGGSGQDSGQAIAVDSFGNAYITGSTSSSDFPTINALYPNRLGGAFVTKLNAAGTQVLYSTYLGGSSSGQDIAVDSEGNAYVTGNTGSSDFPVVNAKYPNITGDYQDAFVTKLNASGSQILYSTYLGGSGGEEAHGIAVDNSGRAYVTGRTWSSDFPVINAKYPTNHGVNEYDAFVTKFNASGSEVLYSTYLGGSHDDYSSGIAVDGIGNAYIVGYTSSSDFPTLNAKYPNIKGGLDLFVTKFNSDGTEILYSTYLGGSFNDYSSGIALDGIGNAYVVGYTQSSDFPTLNAKYPNYGGGLGDIFVTKFNATGAEVLYSTYLGGSAHDANLGGIAVDSTGNAYVTGRTQSSDFPTFNANYPDFWSGFQDVIVTKFNASGSEVLYSTYLGGDHGTDIAVDSAGNAYVIGVPDLDLPTHANDASITSFDSSYNGGGDVFVTKLALAVTSDPGQPVYSPPPPPIVVPPEKSKNLVLLIHGWNSDPSGWANGMQQSIAEQISPNHVGDDLCHNNPIVTATDVWQICTVNWSKDAGLNLLVPWKPHHTPWSAYVNALSIGKQLGQNLVNDNYDFIHFIAHSAGSQVADTAARWINALSKTQQLTKPLIHTTFFDAYDPAGDSSPYGEHSDWAEQYVDMRRTGTPDLDDTDIRLKNAYNFDVTKLDPDTLNIAGTHAHAWPYLWYQKTTEDKSISKDGFALSLEAGSPQIPSHNDKKRGQTCTFSADNEKTCSDNTIIIGEVTCKNLFDCSTMGVPKLSDTGLVSFPSPDTMKLTNLSPAWAELPLEIGEPVNFISFDYTFQRAAEGLLSVFFDGQLVYRADQRLYQTGELNHSDDVPIGDITGGTHSLSIRLDAYNGTKSEIDISNVQLGHKQAVANQPPAANAGADQTTNTGGLVTLNGSGSDPDNLPSPLVYNWIQASGPSVALTGATTASPTFNPTVTGTYLFDLSVSDGQVSSSDQVMVTVVSSPSVVIVPSNPPIAPVPGNQPTVPALVNQPTALNVTKLLINKKTNAFTLASNVTLGTGNNGINPLKESVTAKIGKFATKFPAGAFRKLSSEKFIYVGKSKNAKLKVSITSLGNGLYAFQTTGKGRNLSKTKNPVTVSLSIGDDNATTAVQAAIR